MQIVEEEFAPPTLASPELVVRASALAEQFPECFWFWHPDAKVLHLEDVRLVVEQLREYGGWKAWTAAQELNQCLSPTFKRRS